MSHLTGTDRAQTLLLPEALDDYVGHDNPVRFVDAFVAGLDLAETGFARVGAKPTGRPGYAPPLPFHVLCARNLGRRCPPIC